jgi:hypothetical protein
MDELFRDSPTFVPGSKWTPSSDVNDLARDIAGDGRSKDVEVQYVEEAF